MEDVKEEFKHLRIKSSTHKRVKILAITLGITIDELINQLLDDRNKNAMDR